MSRAEITRKFDEIIAFSEIERFLDTPVKHYSSGMYVRLAFAIAAHLEPEILIVDEVLAVGDAQFQKKCLNKVSEVTRSDGRTVLFVSHNSAALQSICSVASGSGRDSSPARVRSTNAWRDIFTRAAIRPTFPRPQWTSRTSPRCASTPEAPPRPHRGGGRVSSRPFLFRHLSSDHGFLKVRLPHRRQQRSHGRRGLETRSRRAPAW